MTLARLVRRGGSFAAMMSLFILSFAFITLFAGQARAFPGDKNNDPRYTIKYHKDDYGRQSLSITGERDEQKVDRWMHDSRAASSAEGSGQASYWRMPSHPTEQDEAHLALACSNLATSKSEMVNLMAKQKAQRVFDKYGRSELAANVWPGTQYVHEVTVDSPATACAYHNLVRKHVNNLHHGHFFVWAFGIQEKSRGHYEASCIVGSLEDAPAHVKAKELLKPLSARTEEQDELEVSQDNKRIRSKRARSRQSNASSSSGMARETSHSQSEEPIEKRSIVATKLEETCAVGDVKSDSQHKVQKRGCVQSRGGTSSPPRAQQEEEEQQTESEPEQEPEQEPQPQHQTAQPSHPFRKLKPFSAFSPEAQADARTIYHDQEQGHVFEKLLEGKKKCEYRIKFVHDVTRII